MYDKGWTGEPRYDATRYDAGSRLNASFHLSASQRAAIAVKLARKLREIHEASAPSPRVPGIHVLSFSEVAEIIGKSQRQLARLEVMGFVPRRRRISKRRTAFLMHELEGRRPDSVMVCDRRTLGPEQLAVKLGVDKRTVMRMVRRRILPAPTQRRWFERDIDAWLLGCPKV